jgi:hypothetical protein
MIGAPPRSFEFVISMTMKSRLILPVAAAALALAASSCTPWVEPNPPMPPGGDPAARNMPPNAEEQARMKEKRDRMKQKDEEARDRDNNDGQTAGPGDGQGRKEIAPPGDEPAEKPVKEKASAPTAVKVPGKPGMVFSPFNNKLVDVSGIPSGKLVRDPTYPESEKKIFRVP